MALILVTNTNDSGAGSLRAAVEQADLTAARDTIRFNAGLAGQTIALTSGALNPDSAVIIDGDTNGDNKADITVSGSNSSNMFTMSSFLADVELRSLNLTNGYDSIGGAIYIYGDAKLRIIDSTISNSSGGIGGGIRSMYGDVTLVNSLITGNTSYSVGGGISMYMGKLSMVNTTVDGNVASGGGGGIDAASSELTLANSTITANKNIGTADAGGIYNVANTLTLVNSVVAENTNAFGISYDVDGIIDKAISSVFGSGVAITLNTNSAMNVGNVGLGELLDNGGTVLSRSPLDSSFLVDFGDNAALPVDEFDVDGDGNTTELLPLDVRALARIFQGDVDAGAVEWVIHERIHGTDNDNLIFGGIGRDRIWGGDGSDIMDGGSGNDRLYGELDGDLLKGALGDDLLDGGWGDDTMLGGAGNDRLIGGVGIDTLKGGADNDTFVLDRRTAFRDLISDFNPADDVLEVSAADFGGGLAAGALPAGQFVANTTGLAGDANDRFIYNTLTGDLFYDNNGTGAGGDRLIATFTNLAALSASDFIIV